MVLVLASLGFAAGTDQLGTSQALTSAAVLNADILDPTTETIVWEGVGSVTVTAPGGAQSTLASGSSYVPTISGTYVVEPSADQVVGTRWDLAVTGASLGRVWSTSWPFNAGSFDQSAATNGSFYAVVPGGDGRTAVIELQLNGMAGYIFDVSANRVGVDGDNGGRSVPTSGNSVQPEFPIYLQPPELSDYGVLTPSASNLTFESAQAETGYDGEELTCTEFRSGSWETSFSFDTDSEGSYHLRCDLDQSGTFDSAGTDLLLVGATTPGTNTVSWEGRDGWGNTVPPGDYDCYVEVHTGEFHYVGRDIETSFPGMRLFEVGSDGSRGSLFMRWSDGLVQANALTMDNGQLGMETPGEAGMWSGGYTDPVIANVNARSWGAWQGAGKGNNAFLDTYVWLAETATATMQITSADGSLDADGDGLADIDERCVVGTDPNDPDTDGNGVSDGDEFGESVSSSSDGGLESDGERAGAIATWFLDSWMGDPAPPLTPRSAEELAPRIGPAGTTRVEVPAIDLPAITNASAAVAYDYLAPNGSRAGAALLVETTGELYDHTKAICDRAGGSHLESVEDTELGWVARLRSPSGEVDYATTLTAYELDDGSWEVHQGWLVGELPEPGDQRVLTMQLWSRSPAATLELASQALDSFRSELQTTGAPPATFTQGTLRGGSLAWSVDGAGEVIAKVTEEDGSTYTTELTDGSAELAPAREVTLELVQDGAVLDRMWLSDGVWIGLDLALDEQLCEALPAAPMPDGVGSQRLAGCATVDASAGQGVGRHMGKLPFDLSNHESLVVWLSSDAPTTVCLESAELAVFGCTEVPAEPEGAWTVVDLNGFDQTFGDPRSAVDLVSFTATEATELTVAGLTATPWSPEATQNDVEEGVERGCGCNTGAGAGWLALLLPLFLRRR